MLCTGFLSALKLQRVLCLCCFGGNMLIQLKVEFIQPEGKKLFATNEM